MGDALQEYQRIHDEMQENTKDQDKPFLGIPQKRFEEFLAWCDEQGGGPEFTDQVLDVLGASKAAQEFLRRVACKDTRRTKPGDRGLG